MKYDQENCDEMLKTLKVVLLAQGFGTLLTGAIALAAAATQNGNLMAMAAVSGGLTVILFVAGEIYWVASSRRL